MPDSAFSRTAIALRHVPFEDLGCFAAPLAAAGYDLRYLEAGRDDLAAAAAADLLVVLGGPIGVYEDAAYPFLAEEISLVERRLARDLPVLGICLGAQMMARALGSRVYPGNGKEIGWSRLNLTAAGSRSALAPLAADVPVLHWHGDTYDLPAGAEHLAGSAQYPQQAFAYGRGGLALQCHIEVDTAAIEAWLIGHACELAGAGIDPAALRAASRQHGPRLAPVARTAMQEWLAGLPA